MAWVDILTIAILSVALVRGLWIGLVRELFSIAALVAAVFAVRAFTEPTAAAIVERYSMDSLIATGLAGGGIAALALVGVTAIGFALRRLVGFAGLGLADRLGGGVLGLAEGSLFAVLLLFGAVSIVGRSDPLLAESMSLRAYERIESWVGAEDAARTPEAPPPRR